MTDIQYSITIMGKREVSRPYPNVSYRFEKFAFFFYQEIILSSVIFRRETARGFLSLGQCGEPS